MNRRRSAYLVGLACLSAASLVSQVSWASCLGWRLATSEQGVVVEHEATGWRGSAERSQGCELVGQVRMVGESVYIVGERVVLGEGALAWAGELSVWRGEQVWRAKGGSVALSSGEIRLERAWRGEGRAVVQDERRDEVMR